MLVPSLIIAHPLGNFSINRYSRIEVERDAIHVWYVLDLAEIPTFQELPSVDLNHDGQIDDEERRQHAVKMTHSILQLLSLSVDDRQAPLQSISNRIEILPGQGGLQTLRVTIHLLTPLSLSAVSTARVKYRDDVYPGRLGWKEIVARAVNGVVLQNSTVPTEDVSEELRQYPTDMLSSPLQVTTAQFELKPAAFVSTQEAVASSDTRASQRPRVGFAGLITETELTWSFILFALLAAMFWGGAHALSPGHGKTVVAAYLVGSRGTAKHAIFLGATVTITHTIGVFALGLVTLFASQYILPEKLYPWLSLSSGILVVGIGLYLLMQRLGIRRGRNHVHSHSHGDSAREHVHAHGGKAHSHLPPGSDGGPVTWRSLLALGVSGGLLPCPSALVVLLGAISLHRVGFGLLLIVAFSLGLAGVLTGIGLLLVHARRYFDRFRSDGSLMRLLPAASAGFIAIAGLMITAQALSQMGAQMPSWERVVTAFSQPAIVSVLGLGFVLGLKHALDADHLVAVATIVSETRSILGSAVVGAIWGLGHTAALLAAGVIVILLQMQIPERVALGLEFGVALMLVGLGVNLIRKLRRGQNLHMHVHEHGGHIHSHPHLHEHGEADAVQTHHGLQPARQGFRGRPFFIGIVHGMAGSAALMLLVLASIPSPLVGFIYIAIFGAGSIGGMLLMSTAISLPFIFTAARFNRLNATVRAAAAVCSVGFGLFMMYQIGFVERLFL